MGNELIQEGAYEDPYAEFGRSGTTFVGSVLKYTKGEWTTGREGEVVPIGTRLIAYLPSAISGYIKWIDEKPVEQMMRSLEAMYAPPLPGEEPHWKFKRDKPGDKAVRASWGDTDPKGWPRDKNGVPRDPWQHTMQIVLADPETEALYTFSTSSSGGVGTIAGLAQAYSQRKKAYPSPQQMPIIELGSSFYMHTEYGKTLVPVLKIVEWTAELPQSLLDLAPAVVEAELPWDDKPARPGPKLIKQAQSAAPAQRNGPGSKTPRF